MGETTNTQRIAPESSDCLFGEEEGIPTHGQLNDDARPLCVLRIMRQSLV